MFEKSYYFIRILRKISYNLGIKIFQIKNPVIWSLRRNCAIGKQKPQVVRDVFIPYKYGEE